MKVLMINVVCGIRSTGRICTDLASALEAQGHEVRIAYGREDVPETYKKYAIRIGSDLDVKIHGIKARLFDGCGWGSKKATEKFIVWVKKYNPDIIHLNNLHGYYIHVGVLFDYLKTCEKKIIWTLHDCWAFTGHAAYCEYSNCEKWISGCYKCSNIKEYPMSYWDRSKKNWLKKKEKMTQVPAMTIITPSEWLADLVKKSYLKKYPVKVIHNGVDTCVFRPTQSNIKHQLHLENKSIVLGVAALWEKRKGLDDFIRLAQILPRNYQIVLIGVSREQLTELPKEIIGIERTNSVDDLVKMYSAADVYVNLTYEDNYPTTNIEAIACGTPVITYDTGGSPESAREYGVIVKKGDVEKISQMIIEITSRNSFKLLDTQKISADNMLHQYIDVIKQ